MKKTITDRHVGEFEQFCVGCFDPFYTQTFITSVGKSQIKLTEYSSFLDELCAYDHAELDTVYLGQINAITVTSFCGKDGLIWGYDAYPSKDLYKEFLFTVKDYFNNDIKVFSAAPLVAASKALFGTKDNKKFNLIHGSLTPAAQRKIIDKGPKTIYGGLALGIAKNRSVNVDLIMEDIGEIPKGSEKSIVEIQGKVQMNLARSIVEIGKNHNIEFTEIFVNFEHLLLKENEMGCVLLIAPYFKLAKNAILENSELTLEEWNQEIKERYNF